MRTQRFARWLFARLHEYADNTTPDVAIGGFDNPYMLRWFLIRRNRFFNIYLHNVLRDDDDRALHDHPWWSLSLCLRGPLGEIYDKRGEERDRTHYQGDWVLRSAKFSHRLYLPKGRLHSDAWTIFITGPRLREWGFHCDPPVGWRHWKEFTSYNQTGDGHKIGKGCDP